MSSAFKTWVRNNIPFAAGLNSAVRHQLSRAKIRHLLRNRSGISLELGAGEKKGTPPWVTVDVSDKCDIYWDLRRGIPFPDQSLAKIYSSHFFEHLTFKQTQHFLDECLRVMAPGAKFLICVPNARLYLDAYIKGVALDQKRFFGYETAYNSTTLIDYVNYTAYMDGEHKYMFDEDNILFILKAKGFRNVRLRPFDSSIDLAERDFESIYAEADK